MGGGSDPPKAPDYAAANREAVYADIETLPDRLRVNRAAQLGGKYEYVTGTEPIYESRSVQTGTRKEYDQKTGRTFETPIYETKKVQVGERPITKSLDFTGLGDADLIAQQLKAINQTAPGVAQAQLDLQRQFGSQFVDVARENLQRSDPFAFALDETLKQQSLDDLKLGDQLSPEQYRIAQQRTREAQTARGNILGNAPSFQESFALTDAGNILKQQRQNNANVILGRGPMSGQFNTLSGAQSGAAPFQPFQAQANQYLNPNAGAQGAQFAANTYGTQANVYSTKANAPNPWLQGIGTVIGAVAGGVALCWVAREVYGENNPKWLQFRAWLLCKAPKWLVALYRRFGPSIALWLRNKPKIKALIRAWMDARIEGATWQTI